MSGPFGHFLKIEKGDLKELFFEKKQKLEQDLLISQVEQMQARGSAPGVLGKQHFFGTVCLLLEYGIFILIVAFSRFDPSRSGLESVILLLCS